MNAPVLECRREYDGCPLCGSASQPLGISATSAKTPYQIEWMKCGGCAHVHTRHYWTGPGLKDVLKTVTPDQTFGGAVDEQRLLWDAVIHRLLQYVPGDWGKWVDVGTGNGSFVFTAAEFGMDAIGIDVREETVKALKSYGYNAEVCDAMAYDYARSAVVVLADVLEHVPFPKKLLGRIRDGLNGALFVSCPNMDSVSWKYLDRARKNYYWAEAEHHHNFTRQSLFKLLDECGFIVEDYAVSRRYAACMEVIAV